MKNLLSIFALIFILSCDDVINESESNKYGAIKLTFNKPSEELAESVNNNRSMSQFADVDAVRITINNSSPVTVSIVGGSASYSKSGLSVGTATIKVELTGAGITKYTQTKSVTIIADQTASTSFNAFAITNQTMNFTSSFESTYDVGDEISLSWTNSHADQPVDIERWDIVGGAWVKTATLADDYVGSSGTWNTQSASQGETVKVRIQSTISSSFTDSSSFSLTGGQDDRYVDVNLFHGAGGGDGNQFLLGWDSSILISWGEFSGDVDVYWYDTNHNQPVNIVQGFGQSDSSVCAQLPPGSCQYNFYPSNSFDGNSINALIPFLNGSDGDTFPSGETKKFRVCEAGTNDCIDSSDSFSISGWSMNNSFSNVFVGGWTDSNPTGSGGGTGSKYLWSTSMSSINVSTSGGTGDVDLYLYKVNNPNSSSVSFTQVAASAVSGNNESINYTSGDGGWYVLRLYPWNGTSTNGFSVTSTSTRTNDKDVSKFNIE